MKEYKEQQFKILANALKQIAYCHFCGSNGSNPVAFERDAAILASSVHERLRQKEWESIQENAYKYATEKSKVGDEAEWNRYYLEFIKLHYSLNLNHD